MSRVLYILVTYNAICWIERCISSILNANSSNCIFVIDNGSIDGTQDYIKSNYQNIYFYQSDRNLGFGKANNIGIQYAIDNDYEYIYLINQDAWLLSNTVEQLIKIHKKNNQYGILSPIQLQANQRYLDNNFASLVCSFISNKEIVSDFFFVRHADVYPVNFVMAAHWLISRECFCKVGGFSPTFPHYGEDVNYVDRAKFHGFKVGIVPSSIAVHDREYRVESKSRKIYMSYISLLINISCVSNKSTNILCNCIIHTIYSVIKYKSLKPINFLFTIFYKWRTIKRNVNLSRGECAFLKCSI